MRPLSVSELLDAWERGLGLSPPERALTLLAAATDAPPGALARLSIGQRDARLLALRELTFGPRLVSLATCPACGVPLELTFDANDLRLPVAAGTDEVLTLTLGGDEIRFRLPDSLDQVALAGCEDVDAARRLLLRRCLVTAPDDGGADVVAETLSPDAWELIARQLERADPQADIQLQMSCQACAHLWQEAFDIGSFFWAELDGWARRVLVEVHTLARAYGWPERDILRLSEARREFYLNLAGGPA